MQVPLLDLSEQYRRLAEPIREEIEEILRTQNFILGPKVEEFECALADYCGAKHAVGVSSGTDALLDILMALELGPNDASGRIDQPGIGVTSAAPEKIGDRIG